MNLPSEAVDAWTVVKFSPNPENPAAVDAGIVAHFTSTGKCSHLHTMLCQERVVMYLYNDMRDGV